MLAAGVMTSALAAQGPCDITAAAGNPCVAAHSTVRALYGNYAGALYKVTKGFGTPAATSLDVSVGKAGGVADITAHDKFCKAGDCVIEVVYDQSPMHNHLGQRHGLVNSSKHRISVGGGVPVYGMWFDPGYGYHVDFTKGMATGNEPESIYAVMSGTRKQLGKGCCFDYGNSENSVYARNVSDGAGAMEAIYFGNTRWQGNQGNDTEFDGPWVGADLEAGMYYGGGPETKVNMRNKPLRFPFVSLYLGGREDGFTLKGGDATAGVLETMYDGPRPDCKIAATCDRHKNATYTPSYQPMHKQGAIILATGGDNSNTAVGNFYEGIICKGSTSSATDDAVQKNIVSAGYQM